MVLLMKKDTMYCLDAIILLMTFASLSLKLVWIKLGKEWGSKWVIVHNEFFVQVMI